MKSESEKDNQKVTIEIGERQDAQMNRTEKEREGEREKVKERK